MKFPGTSLGIQDGVQDGRRKSENIPILKLRVLFMAKYNIVLLKYA